MKDEDNTLYPQRQPGPLASLLGARVEQWYALDSTVPVSGVWGSGPTTLWAEQLGITSPDTKVLMTYGKSNGWLDGQPAAVTRQVGKGSITYIAAALDEPTMLKAATWMLKESGIDAILPNIPEGVDVALRSGEGKQILILTNYNSDLRTITLPNAMEDVLTGIKSSTVTLPQYGVAVLRMN